MSTTGHELEVVNVQGLKASMKKNGNYAILNDCICSTAGATAAKVTNTVPPSFTLTNKAKILVKFTYGINVAGATLQVGENAAKPIFYQGSALDAGRVKAGMFVLLQYDGTNFNILGDIAKMDEYYKDLHAGLADNLFGETQTNDMFTFRPTAGIQDIESGEPPLGGASVKRIEGNAVAWNQMVKNGDFSSEEYWTHLNEGFTSAVSNGEYVGTVTAAGSKVRIGHELNLPANHKVYVRFDIYPSYSITTSGQFILRSNLDVAFAENDIPNNTWSTYSFFLTPEFETRSFDLFSYSSTESGVQIGDTCKYRNINIIDLTLLFGSGNEPSTVAEFESWLERNIGLKDYYPYNAGELIPVKDFKVKSVGFNALDMSKFPLSAFIYNGSFSISGDEITINVIGADAYIGMQDSEGASYSPVKGALLRVLPNTTYHFHATNENFCKNLVWCYNKEGVCVADTWHTGYGGTDFDFTTPSDAYYVSFRIGTGDAISSGSYTTKICISLSYDDDKDGTYEEHWEHETAIDVTTLKGKLNGTGDSVVVFPDGLKSAGTVHDEIVKAGDVTKAIKRVGSINLGLLDFMRDTSESNPFFISSSISGIAIKSFASEIGLLCGKYDSADYCSSILFFGSEASDKTLSHSSGNNVIFIRDDGYTDATTFKTAMSGVMLYYELATPEEYIIDDALLPVKYAVDDYGTEELLLGNDTEVVSVAPTMTIKYGINAADTVASLPHNYVSSKYQSLNDDEKKTARNNIGAASQKDMIVVKKQLELIDKKVENDYYVDMGLPSGLLWAKRNIDLSQADKFAPSEYSYDASFFSWGNTDGHNPTGTTFDYDFGTSNDGPYASTPGAKLTGNISPSYDAAHVNLGEPWRMPTSEEIKELFDNCDFIDANGDVIPSTTNSKLVTMSGVAGIRLKSKINGRILFFPCCGWSDGTQLYNKGIDGDYRSTSFCTATQARILYFNQDTCQTGNFAYRYSGFVIRPVM